MIRIRNSIIVLLAGIFSASCGSSEDPVGQPKIAASETEVPTIALVMKSLANEFFVTMADGARSHQADNSARYKLVVNGIKNETDLAQQVTLVDQMIATGVDAIVIAPADSKALVPVLARAIEAGIQVVNIDNRLEPDVLQDYEVSIPFVGPDNLQGAQIVGEYLADRLDAGAKVAILEGVPTAFNSQQRTAGFIRAMTNADMDIVDQQSANWDQTMAVTVASGILIKNPELAAILAANDNMALGAVAAVSQIGKSDQIKVVGFDNISAVRKLIGTGQVLATADQHADLLAVYGIESALQALETNRAVSDRATPVDLVTVDTL